VNFGHPLVRTPGRSHGLGEAKTSGSSGHPFLLTGRKSLTGKIIVALILSMLNCKYMCRYNLSVDYHCTVPKTMGWRWFKAIWNGFFRSRERKEENPQNYYIYAPVNGKILSILL
jgi:hypothetical protein